MKKSTGIIASILLILVISWAKDTSRQNTANEKIAQGLPLEEVETPQSLTNYIIRYQPMTVSFNQDTHQPNWVAWELTREETEGEHSRDDAAGFAVDPNVPGCASPADYTRSGYDRGHMAPAGDMKWSPTAMRQSFLMTNISPQAPELNRGAWKKLEEKCRVKAQADSAIIIVCGPIFDNPGQPAINIGNTGVAVPDRFFKVVLSPYTDPPQAIGFIMTNGHVDGGMQNAAVSVDSVESLTGFDFFAALPDDIENTIESRCDFNRWSHIKRRR